jgi:hypothetical protein
VSALPGAHKGDEFLACAPDASSASMIEGSKEEWEGMEELLGDKMEPD